MLRPRRKHTPDRRRANGVVALGVVAVASGLIASCSSCSKDEGRGANASSTLPDGAPAPSRGDDASATGVTGRPKMVAESLPRCRLDGARLVIPGEDVVVGEGLVAGDELLVGVLRREGTKRVASLLRVKTDLSASTTTALGAPHGEAPPAAPYLGPDAAPFVAFYTKTSGPSTGGGKAIALTDLGPVPSDAALGPDASAPPKANTAFRALVVDRVLPEHAKEHAKEGAPPARFVVVQQADESLAYDVAFATSAKDGDAPIVAWDEDAPAAPGRLLPDRGVVKVEIPASGTSPGVAAHVVSPDTSDAESPRLLARGADGYWLAWLAKKTESSGEDAGAAAEGAGERRMVRWVELVALDKKGAPVSPVRRVSPEKGHVASFELARSRGAADGALVVLVQDETAAVEGGGARLLRFTVDGDRLEKLERVESGDLVDGGVGSALADFVGLHAPPSASADGGAARWLAWTDVAEHAHLAPLLDALHVGVATLEPSLDGARVLAAGRPDILFVVAGAGSEGSGATATAAVPTAKTPELRRLVCGK